MLFLKILGVIVMHIFLAAVLHAIASLAQSGVTVLPVMSSGEACIGYLIIYALG